MFLWLIEGTRKCHIEFLISDYNRVSRVHWPAPFIILDMYSLPCIHMHYMSVCEGKMSGLFPGKTRPGDVPYCGHARYICDQWMCCPVNGLCCVWLQAKWTRRFLMLSSWLSSYRPTESSSIHSFVYGYVCVFTYNNMVSNDEVT